MASNSTVAGDAMPGGSGRPGIRRSEEQRTLLEDYAQAESMLRAFTARNFGRMCALCAHWTAYLQAAEGHVAATDGAEAATSQGGASGVGSQGEALGQAAPTSRGQHDEPPGAGSTSGDEPRLGSWVTNCCNANHALEAMSRDTLSGLVAAQEHGEEWWRGVETPPSAPCRALTATGCALARGRPELCNAYFCEAVRDYLWLLGGEPLATQLDRLQQWWRRIYRTYGEAILAGRQDGAAKRGARRRGGPQQRARRETGWGEFPGFLVEFDAALARASRGVTVDDLAARMFKVTGDPALWRPFLAAELEAAGGRFRDNGVRWPDP